MLGTMLITMVKIDGKEKVDLSSLGLGVNGCQGDSARKALIDYFFQAFGVSLTKDNVATSTDSNVVFGSNS